MPRYVSLTGMQDADGLLSKAEGGVFASQQVGTENLGRGAGP